MKKHNLSYLDIDESEFQLKQYAKDVAEIRDAWIVAKYHENELSLMLDLSTALLERMEFDHMDKVSELANSIRNTDERATNEIEYAKSSIERMKRELGICSEKDREITMYDETQTKK